MGGCIHGCLVVWWEWARHTFAQFCSQWFLEKGNVSNAGKIGKIFSCTHFVLWARICTFFGGHVGLVVVCFFEGPPHLALNPPLVLLVYFFFVWFSFVFCFENDFECLRFFLLSLPFFSLSLSLSLFSSFLSSFLVFFHRFAFLLWGLSFLPCFFPFASWNELWGLSFLPCLFALVSWNAQLQNIELDRSLSEILFVLWFPKGHITWPLNPEYFS